MNETNLFAYRDNMIIVMEENGLSRSFEINNLLVTAVELGPIHSDVENIITQDGRIIEIGLPAPLIKLTLEISCAPVDAKGNSNLKVKDGIGKISFKDLLKEQLSIEECFKIIHSKIRRKNDKNKQS